MDLYFTRHGKTQWNLERRFQGREGDSPLLPESLAEVARLGDHLAKVPFEAVYASSSPRAKTTAEEIIKRLDAPVPLYLTDDLRELGLGTLEGQLIDEVVHDHPVALDNLRHHLDRYDPSAFNGEAVQDALERITQVVVQAAASHQGPVLFVGHGASLTAAIQWLAGKELAELRAMGGLVNNSLTIMETTNAAKVPPYRLKVYNDASFLANSDGRDALS